MLRPKRRTPPELRVQPPPGSRGYWLVTHLTRTRTEALRRSGYHTAFQSAFWGVVLLAIAYPIALASCNLVPTFIPEAFDRAAILSVALGVVVPLGLNRVTRSRTRKGGRCVNTGA